MGFCENLRKYRIQKGYTQSEVADKCHVSTVSYSNYETGKTFPHNAQILSDICKVLDIQEYQLFCDEDETEKEIPVPIKKVSVTEEVIESTKQVLFSDEISRFDKHFLASSLFKLIFEFYEQK